jgi:hypothetical protein
MYSDIGGEILIPAKHMFCNPSLFVIARDGISQCGWRGGRRSDTMAVDPTMHVISPSARTNILKTNYSAKVRLCCSVC